MSETTTPRSVTSRSSGATAAARRRPGPAGPANLAGHFGLCLALLFAPAGLAKAQQLQSVDVDEFLGTPENSALGDCLEGKAEGCGKKASGAAHSYTRSELCDKKIIDAEACRPKLGKSRSMKSGERTRLLIVEDDPDSTPLPSIDVEILFASGSDAPLPASASEVKALAEAVADQRFADDRFVVIGHTDAAGSDEYNQALSTRRAAAVRDRLVELSGLPAERFVVAGRGENELKDPAEPLAAENRRVQLVLLK
ncbi:OmpA family protein [Jiella sonneratiae]|uniref:OmpA family protein n=1 Tax=Jiella sonneratiae TaxID=2816856 RepID=A0ABS3JA50_9HYPH|nr:OmpA family protein [Jiella sonneratiae]MBO0906555.1 OmpA family protein [Jiella sonneratiae]